MKGYSDEEIMEAIKKLKSGEDPNIPLTYLRPYLNLTIIPLERICKYCGKNFKVPRNSGLNKYCSQECSALGGAIRKRLYQESRKEEQVKKNKERYTLGEKLLKAELSKTDDTSNIKKTNKEKA